MKKTLGLDLGTNSIGWAVVETDGDGNPQKINGLGSRIIPMDADEMGKFNSGNTISKTANRTSFRGVRRLRERCLLRRERLHRVLNVLGFLPEHYARQIGWNRAEPKSWGKFLDNKEPKLAWRQVGGKNQFLFMNSFEQMLADFAKNHSWLIVNDKKVPLDWTIYYLRKKALTQKISKEELSWLILNFNQKRGYYQLRGEDEEEALKAPKTRKFFDKRKIVDIQDTGREYKGLKVFLVELEDGKKGKIFKKEIPQWIGLEKNIITTVDIDAQGNDKIDDDGLISQRFSIPTDAEWETEWKLIKLKTEKDLIDSTKTVGSFIYDSLLLNPSQKIRGKLVRTIERKFYREELEQILQKQSEFHQELQDRTLYEKCICELYQSNERHRQNIGSWSFADLFIKDIIFYQRPLKSKKSLISDCPFETRYGANKKQYGVKCIAKSHPIFQEFRLWKFVANLKIYQREKEIDGKLYFDYDVTSEFLNTEDDRVALFEWLNDRKEIEQNVLLGSYFKVKKPKGKEAIYPYRWNNVEDKSYPCNETRSAFLSRFEKAGVCTSLLTKEREEALWHILYSVEDKQEIEKALQTFASTHHFNSEFVEVFKKFPPYKKEYGAFSAKAIKKLLPLMRMGKYWDVESIDAKTKERIEKIITGEYDPKIQDKVRDKLLAFKDISQFKALPEWLACYVVYGRFSEAKDILKWETPEDLEKHIKQFKQHSLRNPIVEQVILETLRTVRDIWIKEGQIDEIHVELGREMKNDKKERERLTRTVINNENTNQRIKAMLMEFKNSEYKIEGVIPHSPTQQEILKIYEEYAVGNLTKEDAQYDFISKITKSSQPTKSEILKYKLWLEQKYRSPYTGEPIPLGKLFTPAYEIEHIIPQSRFFDDSFSNKVICESVVNKNPYKDNQLGYEFIKNNEGRIVPELSTLHKTVRIFTKAEYEHFVKAYYAPFKSKMKKLLMDEIPDAFIERQMNDTRYISKEIKRLLSNIVRQQLNNGESEPEATSKNLISVTGAVTSILKQDWGINNKWNELVLPRFERLNELTGSTDFVAYNKEGHKIPRVPFELQKGFTAKRIDHRHHAMDAVVIACATRNHVNYLNNQYARSDNKRYDLKHTLCSKVKTDKNGNYRWVFHLPWATFPQDVKDALDQVIVSFKQNLRVINKSTNHYQIITEIGKKQLVAQTKGNSWAIRKPMHKDTVFGEVNLRKIKEVPLNMALNNPQAIVEKDLKKKIIELQKQGLDAKKIKKHFEENQEIWSDVNLAKIQTYYFTQDRKDPITGQSKERFFASRKDLASLFKDVKEKEKAFKVIESITDSGIQKILLSHLQQKGNDPEAAFSIEGIEEMNRDIKVLNNGKDHKPIIKVRWCEKADKYAIGETGNKKEKFVEAAKGTNLFFAVYEKETYNEAEDKTEISRTYATIPLNVVIDRQKRGLPSAPETDENGNKLKFVLSPNDLVYVPTEEERKNGVDKGNLDNGRIYKFISCTGNEAHFIPAMIASPIIEVKELGSNNKAQRAWSNEMIKEVCIPMKVNRLGDITVIECI